MQRGFMKMFGAFAPVMKISNGVFKYAQPQRLINLALGSSLLTYSLYNFNSNQQAFLAEENIEIEAFPINELKDGEMRTVKVGPKDEDVILVSKVNGKFYATGNNCSHFGAPLDKGVLFEDKVYCPWHAATFSVVDGLPDAGPVFEGIPTFKTFEKNGKLVVVVPKALPGSKRIDMVTRDTNDKRRYVIIGGGPAGLSAAETLRQSGFGGEITIITSEPELPYDRTSLSKNIFHSEIDKLRTRGQDFFDKYGIKVITGKSVTNVNAKDKSVNFDGSSINYDKLLVATGGRPRVPLVEGVNLENVFTLRNYGDLEKIKKSSTNAKNVVIIGSSFIGTEAASSYKNEFKDKVNVTVVDGLSAPFERVLGKDVGNSLKSLHEQNGVKFVLEKGLKAIEGNKKAQKVILTDGTKLDADVVILGTGIQPNTEFVSNALNLEKDGAIPTNEYLQTANEDIFAAGDIVNFPYWYSNQRVRIEHYSEAIQQGQIAAYNMLGRKVAHTAIPFFWTRHYNSSLQYVGNATGFDSVYVDGDTSKQNFLAYYSKGDKILAVAGMGKSPLTMVISQAMQVNALPSLSDIKSGTVTLEDLKKKLQGMKGKGGCRRAGCCKHK